MSASAARHAAAARGICPGLVVLAAAHDPGAADRLAAATIARCRACI